MGTVGDIPADSVGLTATTSGLGASRPGFGVAKSTSFTVLVDLAGLQHPPASSLYRGRQRRSRVMSG